MPLTDWHAGLETGHGGMDEQHRLLFQLHAELRDALRAADGAATGEALALYVEETRRHFAFEEALMTSSAYPAREAHAADHVAYLRDLGALATEAARDPGAAVVRLWVESRSNVWWRHHVRSADVRLAAHLRRAEAPAPQGRGLPSP